MSVLASLVTTTSCGGGGVVATPVPVVGAPAPTTAPLASSSPAREDRWAALTWEQRHDVMTWMVLPNMGRAFQKFHGSPNAVLTCRSCHGMDAEKVGYAMPNGLPALDPAHLPGNDSTVARFMREHVVPEMSDLIEKQVTCFSCHPKGASQ